MKSESILLGMLFVACSSACVLVMGAMLTSTPVSSQWAAAKRAAPAVAMQADCAPSIAADACRASEG